MADCAVTYRVIVLPRLDNGLAILTIIPAHLLDWTGCRQSWTRPLRWFTVFVSSITRLHCSAFELHWFRVPERISHLGLRSLRCQHGIAPQWTPTTNFIVFLILMLDHAYTMTLIATTTVRSTIGDYVFLFCDCTSMEQPHLLAAPEDRTFIAFSQSRLSLKYILEKKWKSTKGNSMSNFNIFRLFDW